MEGVLGGCWGHCVVRRTSPFGEKQRQEMRAGLALRRSTDSSAPFWIIAKARIFDEKAVLKLEIVTSDRSGLGNRGLGENSQLRRMTC